jgi:hypothetical protein
MTVKKTEGVWTLVQDKAKFFKVPFDILGTLVLAESGGNPDADGIDSNGVHSTGLLQANQLGQGAGKTIEWLKNPVNNLNLCTPFIARAYANMPHTLTGYDAVRYVASWSGHNSQNGTSVDADLPQAYKDWMAGSRPKFSVTVDAPDPPKPTHATAAERLKQFQSTRQSVADSVKVGANKDLVNATLLVFDVLEDLLKKDLQLP